MIRKPAAAIAIFALCYLCSLCASCATKKPVPVHDRKTAESIEASSRPEPVGDRLIFLFGDHSIELNLKTLSCRSIDADSNAVTVVSKGAFPSAVYRIDESLSLVSYPGLGLKVKVGIEGSAFLLEVSADKPRSFAWPSVTMRKKGTNLIWPYLEGNDVPLDNATWTGFLSSMEWDTTQNLFMPFWGIESGKRTVTYLFDDPFHNRIAFKDSKDSLRIGLTHEFPDNPDLTKPIRFRIYVDENVSPITPAKHFRKYLKDSGTFVSMEDKIKAAPLLKRLIGASQAYLWDGAPITMEDVKPSAWIPLAKEIMRQAAQAGPTAGKRIMEALSPDRSDIEKMARQSSPSVVMKRGMVHALSDALRSPALYDQSLWPMASLPEEQRRGSERIIGGESLPEHELIRLNSRLLYASFPEYLREPSTWGNGVSTRMIDALAESGMDRFALTCDGIETLDSRPELSAYAKEKGYLLGPYDSYNEVQDPDAPDWSTAAFDQALYETGGIVRSNGKTVEGFLGVGYYLSPLAARPYFEKRVAENFEKAEHSYYFLDCDACGEYFDDYRPGRVLGASGDAAAKIDRIRTVFKKHKVPVASEGGFYLSADCLAVAQGIFFPVIGFSDPDYRSNEMSKYFLGRPLPPEEPEQFFSPASIKPGSATLHSDPRFRLPLYEAVFHDSVVTTSHYSSPSLKFPEIAETTALTEMLYQVAPMYHFNLSRFEEIKKIIKPHVDAFKRTHSYSYRYALDEFEYLSDDRLAQKTRFGGLELIANFKNDDFDAQGVRIPARSVLVRFTDSGESFIYYDPALNGEGEDARDLPSLIAALSSARPDDRERAASALSRIGVQAKASVPALIALLGDGEWAVRAASAKALANMEKEAAPAVPALIGALGDEEWQVRRIAAYALAAVGSKAKAAVPALIKALDDEEWHVRRPAAFALGSIGPAARLALPALRKKLKDPELQVRLAAETAVKDIR